MTVLINMSKSLTKYGSFQEYRKKASDKVAVVTGRWVITAIMCMGHHQLSRFLSSQCCVTIQITGAKETTKTYQSVTFT